MKSSPARIALVSVSLVAAGALFGAIAATVGAFVAVSVTDGPAAAFSWPILGWAAIIGAVLGAPLLPVSSWLLLRRVPLGLAWVGTALGTVLGAVLGWIAASMLRGNPILWPITAALIGFFAAVIVLRLRFSSARPAEAVRVSRGAGA
jgi:hypothetical protein